MRTNHSKKSKGFTLIETLVIATTCSLLLTLTLPGLLHFRQQARQNRARTTSNSWGLRCTTTMMSIIVSTGVVHEPF